jgi:hypothetical protein
MRRTDFGLATLSLAAALTACAKPDTPTEAHGRATPPAVASDLATAPQPYQRMRFVSELEQSRRSAPLRSSAPHASRVVANPRHAAGAAHASLASLVTSAPMQMAMASSAAATAPVAIASTHAAPPISMPAEVAGEFVADRGHREGGFVSNVMIRGGVGPNGKCDPRSDAQAAGMLAGRPNSAMPLMPSASVFGRR